MRRAWCLLATGACSPISNLEVARSTPILSPPPSNGGAPVLDAYSGPELDCDASPDCLRLDAVGVVASGPGGELFDVSGDGALDIVTDGGAFALPSPGMAPGAALAWWDLGRGTLDYDGDGVDDLCIGDAIRAGPLAGFVDDRTDYATTSCPDVDLTGDGVADLARFDEITGTFEIHAGPLAAFDAPPTLAIQFVGDPGDPDLSSCYGDYGFFDATNEFDVLSADVLADAGPEIVVADDYYWADGYGGCPLAEPLVVPAGMGGVRSVDALAAGGLVRSVLRPGPLPDVDGDGIDDLYLHGSYTAATIHRAPAPVADGVLGDGDFLGPFDYSAVYLPDVDGDGRADLARLEGGALVISSGDGAGGSAAELASIPCGDAQAWYEARTDVLHVATGEFHAFVRRTDLAERLTQATR